MTEPKNPHDTKAVDSESRGHTKQEWLWAAHAWMPPLAPPGLTPFINKKEGRGSACASRTPRRFHSVVGLCSGVLD